jgi:hypothetical protein
LNAACEEACGKLETAIPDAFAAVRRESPLSLQTRSTLAQFIALHVVRTPAFRRWFEPTRDASIEQYRDQFPNATKFERWRQEMRSDEERAKKLLSLINKLGSVIGSMHWTLLRFDERRLITSDQPVCPVPLLTPGVIHPIEAMPADGWLDTCEIRFPISPQIALLATWYMGPERASLTGMWRHAVNINASVAQQAVNQRFQVPDVEPAMPGAIFLDRRPLLAPISIDVLAGYSLAAARESPRRRQTAEELERLIHDRDHETVRLLSAA